MPFCTIYLYERGSVALAASNKQPLEKTPTITDHKRLVPFSSDLSVQEALGNYGQGTSCYFDLQNPKSPCHERSCGFGVGPPPPGTHEAKDDEEEDSDKALQQEMTCVRYILDYCQRYEDRGCVIELPQMLNKRSDDDFDMIRKVPSKFND